MINKGRPAWIFSCFSIGRLEALSFVEGLAVEF